MSHIEPKVPLEELDPGRGDPAYWERFQGRVMQSAASRLERRRRAALTAGDVLLSWGRLLVPGTVAAAAVAALLVLQPVPMDDLESVAGLEEILADAENEGAPLPAFLHREQIVERDHVLFAVQDY